MSGDSSRGSKPVRCIDLDINELREHIESLNGGFIIMRGWMKLAGMPAMIKDGLGRIVFMNKKAEDLLGIKLPAQFGKTLADSQSVGDPFRTSQQDGQVFRTKEAGVWVNQFIDLHDRVVRYAVVKFPFTDDSGDMFIGWIGIRFEGDSLAASQAD